MQSKSGDAGGDGGADVEQIRIALGARADYRVGEDDGVRFAPRDLLSEFRRHVGLIGRAGPGGDAAHAVIGDHLALGFGGPILGHGPFAPVALIESADVERRGDGNFGAEFGETLGEFEAGFAHIYGAVDVGLRNIEERGRALDFAHADDDSHGHAGGGSEVAGEQRLVAGGEEH